MKSVDRVLGFCLAMVVLAGSGCASIINGRHTDIAINSDPPAANVAVRDEQGEVVATAITPTTVSLRRGRGIFRKAPRYVATIEKPGFEPAHIPIKGKVNPWIFGNVVLGGVVGLVADSATGAMWKMTPDEIEQRLTPYQGPYYGQTHSGEIQQAAHVTDQTGD